MECGGMQSHGMQCEAIQRGRMQWGEKQRNAMQAISRDEAGTVGQGPALRPP